MMIPQMTFKESQLNRQQQLHKLIQKELSDFIGRIAPLSDELDCITRTQYEALRTLRQKLTLFHIVFSPAEQKTDRNIAALGRLWRLIDNYDAEKDGNEVLKETVKTMRSAKFALECHGRDIINMVNMLKDRGFIKVQTVEEEIETVDREMAWMLEHVRASREGFQKNLEGNM